MQEEFVPVRYSIPAKAASLFEEIDMWHEQQSICCTAKALT